MWVWIKVADINAFVTKSVQVSLCKLQEYLSNQVWGWEKVHCYISNKPKDTFVKYFEIPQQHEHAFGTECLLSQVCMVLMWDCYKGHQNTPESSASKNPQKTLKPYSISASSISADMVR